MRRLLLAVLIGFAIGGGAARADTQTGTLLMPAWSPDGAQVAWMNASFAGVKMPSWQIWTAAPDGTGARMVAHGAPLSEGASQLDWFSPGTLAFFGNYSLYIAPLGGTPKMLASDVGDAFSRDKAADRFAFTASKCGQGRCPSRIIVLDRTTGKRFAIGGAQARYFEPSLSPDGSRVVFVSPAGLEVAHVDAGQLHRIAPLANCPYWSPDGRHILYVGPGGSLRVIAPGGGRSIVLVARNVGCGYAPFNFGWSPDGKSIAIIGPHGRLSLIDLASRKMHKIDPFPNVAGFAWSPDSSQLLVASRPEPTACTSIWRVDVVGSNKQLIARC